MKVIESYIYIGANRRADVPVIEYLFAFDETELTIPVNAQWQEFSAQLAEVGLELEQALSDGLRGECCTYFGALYAQAALSLQRAAGHRVKFTQCFAGKGVRHCRVIYEYEEREVGRRAGELAFYLLGQLLPSLEVEFEIIDSSDSWEQLRREFFEYARGRVLPIDTEIIIDAATRASVPCCKLDRFPFETRPEDFRIRRNSALRLGYGRYQHIVDSTFCVDRCSNLLPLLCNRASLLGLLHECGLPTPVLDPESSRLTTLSRASRAAARIGYPVVVKPTEKSGRQAISVAVADHEALALAVERVRRLGSGVWLEQHIAGREYRVVIANRHYLGTVALNPSCSGEVKNPHPSLIAHAQRVAETLDVGILVLTYITIDIYKPIEQTGGAFVDLDLAPRLDDFLDPDSSLMRAAAEGLVHWLFPRGDRARIPLVAVTGTNGKTTTSRMIHAILRHAGLSPGLACSEGLYLPDNSTLAQGDLAGVFGHLQLLGSPDIGSAVLETARGAVAKWGFGFDHCDVGVCLNVTEDHLQDSGIETLQDLTDLKRSIVSRARGAVVLNADNPACVSMLPFHDSQRVTLTSTEKTLQLLQGAHPDCDCFTLVERIDGRDHVVIYDRGCRVPVVALADIPATFDGAARHNVSNALHACCACYLLQVDISAIRSGISSFIMSFENTPGRMNIYGELPFQFILDYAHNPNGVSEFCRFIERLKVNGRKIVAFSAAGYNPLEITRGNAQALAGYFDQYYCFNFLGNIEKGYDHVPGCLRDALIDSGVPAEGVAVRETGMDALEEILSQAAEGDLVVFLSGRRDRKQLWERVLEAGRGRVTVHRSE